VGATPTSSISVDFAAWKANQRAITMAADLAAADLKAAHDRNAPPKRK
jgi:hypothetical protein